MTTTATSVFDPTGAAPWAAAVITQDTVANTENVFFFLRPATPGGYGGGLQQDYSVASNGSLTIKDQVFYEPNGAIVATYFGSEAANPLLATVPASTGFTPANPGFSYTQYTYSSPGVLVQVIAHDNASGKTYIGTGATLV